MNDQNFPGKFFVIEGSDGSGKTTQFDLLAKRLVKEGYDIVVFDFPKYEHESSYFVREYLQGTYGDTTDVGPYTASVFFALDRFSAKKAIIEALKQGKIVLSNRYVGSNMAHQGAKFINHEERRGFFIWNDNLEFQMLGSVRPTISFVLRLDAETSYELIKIRAAEQNKQLDIHEKNLPFLRKSVEVYDDLCTLFPKDFYRIDCVRSNRLLNRQHIHELIWAQIAPMLPAPHSTTGSLTKGNDITESTSQLDKSQADIQPEYIYKNANGSYSITETGKEFLKNVVTNTTGNVYAFTEGMSPITIAAAMARLSRRGDDMRVTILDEFSGLNGKKDEQLLRRVITAYGDDSVQQLVGQHIVVEGASNLLTKKLEWGRLASYLEQSTRYIYFDQKDEHGNFKYFTPTYLPENLLERYRSTMDTIFETYSDIVHRLTDYIRSQSTVPQQERDAAWKGATRAQACDAARPLLPVATKATVGVFASGQALENLIMHLQSDELPEARETGKKILEESRKVIGTFLERADKPERGGATIAYRAHTKQSVKKLAESLLPAHHTGGTQEVTLVDYWPKNELELVADMLYEHTDMPLQDIRASVADLSYEQKQHVFSAYMGERLNRRHRPGRALEKAHYSWDIVCDYGIFRDLQRHRMVDDLQWQMLTPRFGYDVPQLVVDAGLTDAFESCFDHSLQLFSELSAAGFTHEAQYATLLGHKMRWKITYNARQAFHLHELRSTPQGHPGYRKLILHMHEKLAEKHPMLASAMKFVNQDEDPELTRLAAERATQFKLEQLEQKTS